MAFGMADWGLDVVELPSQFINRHDPRIIVPLAAVRKVGNIPVMIEQVKAVFADGKVGVFMNRDCQAKVDQCPQAMQSRRIAEQLIKTPSLLKRSGSLPVWPSFSSMASQTKCQ